MCGRYFFSKESTDQKIIALLGMMERRYPGAYQTGEIAPGDTAPGIIEHRGKIVPVPAVFGFPGFQGSRLLINARSETAAEKRTFADSLRCRRMILPASGFFEWHRGTEGKKTKYLFDVDGIQTIYLCGIYKIIDGGYRFVVLTRAANESIEPIHDRMPVVVREREVRPYLENLDVARKMIAGPSPRLNHHLASTSKSMKEEAI